MRIRDFEDIVTERFYFMTDVFPDTRMSLKKIRLVKDMTLEIFINDKYVDLKMLHEIMETIDIIGEQTKYGHTIMDLHFRQETYTYYNNIHSKQLHLKVKFTHNKNSL